MGPWTQADLDKHAAEHHGLTGTKGPDASGLTTHYFGDGTYVTMLGDLPRMFGSGTLAEDDAAPPQQQRGMGMTQQELEAILGGFGALGPGDFREEVKQEDVKNPDAYDANGEYINGAPLTVKGNVTYRTWVKPGTNQRLTVKVNQDGSYTQVFSGADAGIKPEAQTSKPAIGRVEGTPMPDGTFDNTKPIWVERDPVTNQQIGSSKPLTAQQREQWEREKNGGKTDKELADATEEASSQDAVPNRPGWVKITRKKGNDTKTVYRGPDGKEVESLPEEVKVGSEQFVHSDGKTYVKVTKTEGGVTSIYFTDTTGNRVTLPGKESKTVTQKRAPNGTVYYEVSVEKDGKKETYTASDAEGAVRIPPPGQSAMEGVKGVPSFTPDLTKPGAGLIGRQKQLDELMAAGKLTWEQRQAVLEQDIKTANTVVGEFNSASTMLREDYSQRASQRGQDVQQANSRATLANTHYQNAVGLVEKFAPYLGVTPGDAGKLFMGMMASQLATATMYGGMKDVPREDMNPQLRGWAEQTVGRSLDPTGAAIPPGPGEAAGPVAAGVAATNAAAANPTGANVQAATDATMQGSAAAFGALGIPPANPDPRAVEAAFRATGQPLPAPLIGPTPLTPAIPDAPAQTGQAPQPVGMGLPAPMAGGNAGVGEALFGKSLPEPSSWRQDAEDRMYALTMPQQQAYSAGAGLFGASLPPALTQPAGGIDYGLSMPQGNGGMDAIDAEARRQLAAAGIMV